MKTNLENKITQETKQFIDMWSNQKQMEGTHLKKMKQLIVGQKTVWLLGKI